MSTNDTLQIHWTGGVLAYDPALIPQTQCAGCGTWYQVPPQPAPLGWGWREPKPQPQLRCLKCGHIWTPREWQDPAKEAR